jgi:hypothetical protein
MTFEQDKRSVPAPPRGFFGKAINGEARGATVKQGASDKRPPLFHEAGPRAHSFKAFEYSLFENSGAGRIALFVR